jgi:hypothetical protein
MRLDMTKYQSGSAGEEHLICSASSPLMRTHGEQVMTKKLAGVTDLPQWLGFQSERLILLYPSVYQGQTLPRLPKGS